MGSSIINSQHCRKEYWKCKLNEYWECKVRNVSGVEPSDDDVDQNSDVNGRNVRKKSNQKIECVQKVLCFDY